MRYFACTRTYFEVEFRKKLPVRMIFVYASRFSWGDALMKSDITSFSLEFTILYPSLFHEYLHE